MKTKDKFKNFIIYFFSIIGVISTILFFIYYITPLLVNQKQGKRIEIIQSRTYSPYCNDYTICTRLYIYNSNEDINPYLYSSEMESSSLSKTDSILKTQMKTALVSKAKILNTKNDFNKKYIYYEK